MIEPNPQRQIRVNAAMEALRNIQKGCLLTYAEIKQGLGLDPMDKYDYGILYQARDRLMRSEKCTFRIEPLAGIRRLDDSGVLSDSTRDNRINGQIRRKEHELKGVDYDSLSESEQEEYVRKRVACSLQKNLLRPKPKPQDRGFPSASETDWSRVFTNGLPDGLI